MANQELVKFFKNNISNHTLAELKASLIKQGWSGKDVDEAAEYALHDEEHLNDILSVGKEDLIPGTVHDLNKNMPAKLEEEQSHHISGLKMFIFIVLGAGFVIFMVFGGIMLFTGDEDIVAEKVIDSQPVNSISEALAIMKNMFPDFNGDVQDMNDKWSACYDSDQLRTCCTIQKLDGATNCETSVL